MIRKTRTRTIAIAAAAAALALPSAAAAESVSQPMGFTAPCSELTDVAGSYFNVRLCNVSDIDQFRNALPGDGNVYCGPGSLFNSLHWLTHQRGVPSSFLTAFNTTTKMADVDPLDPADYALGSYWLWRLGQEAKINGGTKLSDLRTAFDVATAPAKAAGWTLSRGGIGTGDVTDFGLAMAKKLRFAPLQMAYGRYKSVGNDLQRDGGHIVTVVSVRGNAGGDELELTLSDPGRAADSKIGNYLDTQSAYRLETVKLKKVTFTEVYTESSYQEDSMGEGGTGGGGGGIRTITRWELTGEHYGDANTTTRQMVEGFNWFMAQKGLNP